jgi:hypothetical protein
MFPISNILNKANKALENVVGSKIDRIICEIASLVVAIASASNVVTTLHRIRP